MNRSGWLLTGLNMSQILFYGNKIIKYWIKNNENIQDYMRDPVAGFTLAESTFSGFEVMNEAETEFGTQPSFNNYSIKSKEIHMATLKAKVKEENETNLKKIAKTLIIVTSSFYPSAMEKSLQTMFKYLKAKIGKVKLDEKTKKDDTSDAEFIANVIFTTLKTPNKILNEEKSFFVLTCLLKAVLLLKIPMDDLKVFLHGKEIVCPEIDPTDGMETGKNEEW